MLKNKTHQRRASPEGGGAAVTLRAEWQGHIKTERGNNGTQHDFFAPQRKSTWTNDLRLAETASYPTRCQLHQQTTRIMGAVQG